MRRFIVENVEQHPGDIVRRTAGKFGCTRQAVHAHMRRLVADGTLTAEGRTQRKTYHLAPLFRWDGSYALSDGPTEDRVWREDVAPRLGKLPDNVVDIWQYGFTEMFNNAIDHSGGGRVSVKLTKTAASTEIWIRDDGVGIFKKIQAALGLADERHSVLELAKGKLTTDPANHTGEGIFFASRMFDKFMILSGGVFFSHHFGEPEDWILQSSRDARGTNVWMVLHNHTSRTMRKVFDSFTSDDDYGFTKTVVPVRLTQYGDDNLVSRSQARRLLSRFDRFKVVVLDFSGVASVGQAFADEVFRVFARRHPDIDLVATHTSSEVRRMIARARSTDLPPLAQPAA